MINNSSLNDNDANTAEAILNKKKQAFEKSLNTQIRKEKTANEEKGITIIKFAKYSASWNIDNKEPKAPVFLADVTIKKGGKYFLNISNEFEINNVSITGVATAGGNIGNVQFHNNAGLIAGSDDFVFNPNTQKVGIGTVIPRGKLDIIGDLFVEGNFGVGTTIPTSAVSGSNTKVIHAGIVTANNFYGSGASLTSLDASQLSSGIVPTARLSGTYDINITGSIDGVGQAIGIDTITVNKILTVGAGNTFLKSDFNGNLEVTGVTTTGTLHIGSNNIGITTILDEDNMASDSATALVTQQSIKKYVDDQITNEDLDISDGSVNSSVDLDSQSLTIQGTSNEVDVALSSQTYTVGLPNDVTVAGTLTVNTGIANTMSLSNTLTNVGQTTNQIILHTLNSSEYRSIEYSIQVDQGSNFHLTKLLTIHDGTTAYLTEYGTIFNNSTIATYNVDIAGGNIRLLATAGSATAANYVVNFVANKV